MTEQTRETDFADDLPPVDVYDSWTEPDDGGDGDANGSDTGNAPPSRGNGGSEDPRARRGAELRVLLAQQMASGDWAGVRETARQLSEIEGGGESGASFVTIDASAIFAPLEPIDWTIADLVPAGSIVEVESYGGSGKSWLGVEAAVAVALGRLYLGRFPTTGGEVAYLDFENGSREMRRRLKACARAHGFERVDGLVLVSMPSLYLTDSRTEAALVALATGRGLVIIDTLRAGVPDVDENDSRIRMPLDMLRRVAEQTGCAFVVLVHSKKTSTSIREVDLREAGRGSSAIFDAADVVLHCAYQDGTLRVTCAKSRMGAAFAPFVVTITDGQDGAVHVIAGDAPTVEDIADRERDQLTDRVLGIVRANPGCSARFVTERAHVKYGRAAAALEILKRAGAVQNLGRKGERAKACWYAVGADGRTEGAP